MWCIDFRASISACDFESCWPAEPRSHFGSNRAVGTNAQPRRSRDASVAAPCFVSTSMALCPRRDEQGTAVDAWARDSTVFRDLAEGVWVDASRWFGQIKFRVYLNSVLARRMARINAFVRRRSAERWQTFGIVSLHKSAYLSHPSGKHGVNRHRKFNLTRQL